MAYNQFKSIKTYLLCHGYTLHSDIEDFLSNRCIIISCHNNHLKKSYLYKDILQRKHLNITICKECHKIYRKKMMDLCLNKIFI